VEITEQTVVADVVGLAAFSDCFFQDTNAAVRGEITPEIVANTVARHVCRRTLVRAGTRLVF
jgi:hypothetical protein